MTSKAVLPGSASKSRARRSIALPSLRELVRGLLDRILGHDFFIAYAHKDGDTFPKILHDGLTHLGYKTFLDEAGGYTGGAEITRGTARFAGNARRLIVIAGPAALASRWVVAETLASQLRNRVQIIIEDEARSFESAPADSRIKRHLLLLAASIITIHQHCFWWAFGGGLSNFQIPLKPLAHFAEMAARWR